MKKYTDKMDILGPKLPRATFSPTMSPQNTSVKQVSAADNLKNKLEMAMNLKYKLGSNINRLTA